MRRGTLIGGLIGLLIGVALIVLSPFYVDKTEADALPLLFVFVVFMGTGMGHVFSVEREIKRKETEK